MFVKYFKSQILKTLMAAIICSGILSGCTNIRPLSESGGSLYATYYITTDENGVEILNCQITNIGESAIYIRNQLYCEWHLNDQLVYDRPELILTNSFAVIEGSHLAYILIPPSPKRIILSGYVPDTSLRFSHKIEIGNEKILTKEFPFEVTISFLATEGNIKNSEPLTLKAHKLAEVTKNFGHLGQ